MNADFPDALPPLFYEGLIQLNSGLYFVCHETLEGLWLEEKGQVRQLYQGVIQVSVGCFHLTVRGNWVGATRKLDEGARRIARTLPLVPVSAGGYGVDWAGLVAGADGLGAHLVGLGREKVGEFDRGLLPHVGWRELGA